MNRLFKGFAVVMTAMVAIVIILLVVKLLQDKLSIFSLRGGDLKMFYLFLGYPETLLNFVPLLTASAVETALFWLLVLLDVISQRRGLIATLVLFIFVGIIVLLLSTVSIGVLS